MESGTLQEDLLPLDLGTSYSAIAFEPDDSAVSYAFTPGSTIQASSLMAASDSKVNSSSSSVSAQPCACCSTNVGTINNCVMCGFASNNDNRNSHNSYKALPYFSSVSSQTQRNLNVTAPTATVTMTKYSKRKNNSMNNNHNSNWNANKSISPFAKNESIAIQLCEAELKETNLRNIELSRQNQSLSNELMREKDVSQQRAVELDSLNGTLQMHQRRLQAQQQEIKSMRTRVEETECKIQKRQAQVKELDINSDNLNTAISVGLEHWYQIYSPSNQFAHIIGDPPQEMTDLSSLESNQPIPAELLSRTMSSVAKTTNVLASKVYSLQEHITTIAKRAPEQAAETKQKCAFQIIKIQAKMRTQQQRLADYFYRKLILSQLLTHWRRQMLKRQDERRIENLTTLLQVKHRKRTISEALKVWQEYASARSLRHRLFACCRSLRYRALASLMFKRWRNKLKAKQKLTRSARQLSNLQQNRQIRVQQEIFHLWRYRTKCQQLSRAKAALNKSMKKANVFKRKVQATSKQVCHKVEQLNQKVKTLRKRCSSLGHQVCFHMQTTRRYGLLHAVMVNWRVYTARQVHFRRVSRQLERNTQTRRKSWVICHWWRRTLRTKQLEQKQNILIQLQQTRVKAQVLATWRRVLLVNLQRKQINSMNQQYQDELAKRKSLKEWRYNVQHKQSTQALAAQKLIGLFNESNRQAIRASFKKWKFTVKREEAIESFISRKSEQRKSFMIKRYFEIWRCEQARLSEMSKTAATWASQRRFQTATTLKRDALRQWHIQTQRRKAAGATIWRLLIKKRDRLRRIIFSRFQQQKLAALRQQAEYSQVRLAQTIDAAKQDLDQCLQELRESRASEALLKEENTKQSQTIQQQTQNIQLLNQNIQAVEEDFEESEAKQKQLVEQLTLVKNQANIMEEEYKQANHLLQEELIQERTTIRKMLKTIELLKAQNMGQADAGNLFKQNLAR